MISIANTLSGYYAGIPMNLQKAALLLVKNQVLWQHFPGPVFYFYPTLNQAK